MVAVADAFSLQLPVAAFRTSERAAHFLRLVLAAMRRLWSIHVPALACAAKLG
jgi:hypothetical protein